MDLKELSIPMETTATNTTVLKPTTVIASTISREYLKVLELREYCKMIESDLKEYETKVQLLISTKSETAKIKADYKRRNKVNATNSESLLQAKNELYKYKCELKSSYVATEKSLKFKKLKYKKIISSYESDWQKTLKEFNANPIVVELRKVEEENALLEKKIDKQGKLNSCTEQQFFELKKHTQRTFLKKMVEFSKNMILHKELAEARKGNREITSLKLQKNPETSFAFKLFKGETTPFSGKYCTGSESSDDGNCFSSIDVSIFDDLTVPSENLESQHLEEDIYSPSQNKEPLSDTSKDHEEDLEYLNKLKHYQVVEQKINKKLLHPSGGNLIQVSAKTAIVDENESQYFRLQSSECSEQPKNVESNSGKSKSVNEVSDGPVQNVQDNEEDVQREQQMECEESLSDASSENQFGRQRDIYDYQYRKVSSFPSDEFPPPAENTNVEALESPPKPHEGEENHLFRPGESEKIKSFAGFFTIGNDYDSPKPSIFKLF